MLRRLRALDFLAILLSIGAVAALSVRAYGEQGAGIRVQIDAEGGSWIYPLDQNRTVTLEGPVGHNVIEIRDGVARVVEADCRDKICVTMGAITRPGSWVACLPNRVFLRVLGADAGSDAVSY